MLNLREELRSVIATAITRAQEAGDIPKGEIPTVVVEHPPTREEGERLGDYASPIALALARRWKREPMEVLERIAKHLTPPEFVGKLEGMAPGFLNVQLSPDWLAEKIDDLVEAGGDLGRSDDGRGAAVNLEFGSANPTGPLHLGHGRSLFAADVLGNVLAHLGYAVTREYYINDTGTQVEKYGESVLRRILEAAGHAVEFPSGLYPGEDVNAIAEAVREEMAEDRGHTFSPDDLNNADLRAEVTRRAVAATVRAIRRFTEETAKVRYDVWFSESTLHERGDVADVLQELKKRGAAVEREGALWLTSTRFGDDKDRVLVRSNGEVTYLASDIAYHRDKLRRGASVLINFWGADHQGHLLPLKAALQALGEDADKLEVIFVHLVRVFQGGEAQKISKRAGTAVPLEEIIDAIGLSAARFFLTMHALESPFDLDLDLARAQKEENPVYYAQYAYVRLTSILRKARERNLLDGLVGPPLAARAPLADPAERRLLALAMRLPEVLQDVARTRAVQRLPQYALELAAAIHRFYDTVPVLQVAERDLLATRLALVVSLQTVLGRVFDLLGVEKPEVM